MDTNSGCIGDFIGIRLIESKTLPLTVIKDGKEIVVEYILIDPKILVASAEYIAKSKQIISIGMKDD